MSRGYKHDYLGMEVELKDKKVHVRMRGQIAEAIEWGGSQIGRMPATPTTVELFNVDKQATLLNQSEAELYHSFVQKLMYICERACPDIEPALSFLSTRVANPNKDDQRKLYRVLDFLKDTIKDDRIIGANDLSEICMWVDASFAVHPNM